MLDQEILSILQTPICDEETRNQFLKRLKEGLLTRDENPNTHFCAYFLPYNLENKKVFIVHHKKSGLWLAPGGHIDKGETIMETLNREIHEELGVPSFFEAPPLPFLLTITPITHGRTPCKKHYDVWHTMNTDGANFQIDPREFHDTRWCTIKEAEEIIIDPANKKALEYIKTNF